MGTNEVARQIRRPKAFFGDTCTASIAQQPPIACQYSGLRFSSHPECQSHPPLLHLPPGSCPVTKRHTPICLYIIATFTIVSGSLFTANTQAENPLASGLGHSQHPHSVSTVSIHCTHVFKTHTRITYPHKVPIQGTQDTYCTAHMCTVYMLPYTACLIPKL